uniref:Uncharacterized protein n=1 Tax=Panagrolaimus sp. ES5 TaxID=591445 RepID=A0AC34F4F7_9BILA
MIVSPLGERNLLFVEDLEALLIRISKMKLLNDGKSIENECKDVGYLNSKYKVFEAILDQDDHPRRSYLIKVLNQLIEFTLNSNVKV